MPKAGWMLAVALALGACTSRQDVAAMPPTTVLTFEEPAEVVYARTVRAMRTCLNAGPSPIIFGPSSALDADWFPGLVAGEISYSVNGMPTILARVDGTATTARVQVTYANSLGPVVRLYDTWMTHWTAGGQSCTLPAASGPAT